MLVDHPTNTNVWSSAYMTVAAIQPVHTQGCGAHSGHINI